MAQTLDRLLASAKARCFQSEADVDRYLQAMEVRDVQTRIAFKHSLQARGELATDLPTQPPAAISRMMPEIESLMRKAGLEPGRRYTERQVDVLLKDVGLSPEARISIKTELMGRDWRA
jgi:hypothetical protein